MTYQPLIAASPDQMLVFGQPLLGIERPGHVAPAQDQRHDVEIGDTHGQDYGRDSEDRA